MSQGVIRAEGLKKTYRDIRALDGVDIEVRPGEIFGLLGPNGAGKTTAVKILLGLTHPTEGRASIGGIDSSRPESRARVGYLPEGHRFPGYLTARSTLSVFGRMSGMSASEISRRVPELLARVRLEPWAGVRVRKFSKGMVQRLGLATALVSDPDVLLLDEPTDGVDPVGRREIRDLLLEQAARGKAILVNSHLLSEIEMTCGRVAILKQGRIAAQGTIAELTRRESRYRLAATGLDESLLEVFRSTGAAAERQNGHVLLSVRDVAHLNELVDRLRGRGGELTELSPLKSSLEEVFVELFRNASDAGEASQRAGEASLERPSR